MNMEKIIPINQQSVISGNNFSSYADVIFSERVSKSSFQKIKLHNNCKVVQEIENNFS